MKVLTEINDNILEGFSSQTSTIKMAVKEAIKEVLEPEIKILNLKIDERLNEVRSVQLVAYDNLTFQEDVANAGAQNQNNE